MDPSPWGRGGEGHAREWWYGSPCLNFGTSIEIAARSFSMLVHMSPATTNPSSSSAAGSDASQFQFSLCSTCRSETPQSLAIGSRTFQDRSATSAW